MARFDRGIKVYTGNFTTDASGNAVITTESLNGIIQRVSLVEGTISANDWSFVLRDADSFTIYSNTSVTANVTIAPSKVGTAGVVDYLYAVDSAMTATIANGGNAQAGRFRVYLL